MRYSGMEEEGSGEFFACQRFRRPWSMVFMSMISRGLKERKCLWIVVIEFC
jgi:hypothetical protein